MTTLSRTVSKFRRVFGLSTRTFDIEARLNDRLSALSDAAAQRLPTRRTH